MGLWNPFRFSFDRGKPILAIADVGENRFEEVDYMRTAEARGATSAGRRSRVGRPTAAV